MLAASLCPTAQESAPDYRPRTNLKVNIAQFIQDDDSQNEIRMLDVVGETNASMTSNIWTFTEMKSDVFKICLEKSTTNACVSSFPGYSGLGIECDVEEDRCEMMSETDSLRSFITMQLCLTDEEAQALDTSGGEDPLPLPSQLRCVSEQTELENLFIIYQAFVDLESSTEPPTPSPEMTKAVAEITAAQETCDIPTIIQEEGAAP